MTHIYAIKTVITSLELNKRESTHKSTCRSEYKLQEEDSVAPPHAVACPRTVVVKLKHAVLTGGAVLGARRAIDVACGAELPTQLA
jgi:hypothetical protein